MFEKKRINVFEHELVPKHELLISVEVEDVLKLFRAKPYQLLHLKASDPAAQAIGAKPGDVVKVTRKSPTAGVAIVYRYVVEG